MIQQTKATWLEEGKKLYGEDMKKWQFRCPSCETVSTPEDFKDIGVEGTLALSNCIGRYTEGRGCDWTAGGLFGTLGKGRLVKDEQGVIHEIFSFHTDENAVIEFIENKVVGLGVKSWDDFTWDDWVPQEVRAQIMDFWGCFGRNPDQWARDQDVQRAPSYGSIVTLRKSFGNETATGRYVHAWNNIGRIVHDDGSFSYVSF